MVPFDSPTQISDYDGDYQETFKRGAFTRSIAERGDRIKFLSQHQRTTNPLGRAVLLREDTAGLYGEFRVSATQAGDEVLELIRDGALDSFSVGFQPIRETWNRNRTERTHYESKLTEVSVVSLPCLRAGTHRGRTGSSTPTTRLESTSGPSRATQSNVRAVKPSHSKGTAMKIDTKDARFDALRTMNREERAAKLTEHQAYVEPFTTRSEAINAEEAERLATVLDEIEFLCHVREQEQRLLQLAGTSGEARRSSQHSRTQGQRPDQGCSAE